MPVRIKQVRLNKSIYVRVPSNFVEMIGLGRKEELSLTFQDTDQEFRLIYSVPKPQHRIGNRDRAHHEKQNVNGNSHSSVGR